MDVNKHNGSHTGAFAGGTNIVYLGSTGYPVWWWCHLLTVSPWPSTENACRNSPATFSKLSSHCSVELSLVFNEYFSFTLSSLEKLVCDSLLRERLEFFNNALHTDSVR